MHPSPSWKGVARPLMLAAGSVVAMATLALTPCAAADVDAGLHKANLYIEVSRMTERARDSWERYASWVNMKTGPTGKERYISYGLYDVYDIAALLTEARGASSLKPDTPELDAAMQSYMESYEAVAPVLNQASQYYEREAYRADGMAEGKALHTRMVPLAEAFLAKREAMLEKLRPFVREVEQQEVADIEAREGRSRAWQAANVMHAANRVVDTFPKVRPTPMDADMLDEMMSKLGPDTPGETFDQIMAGVVPPKGVIIDMARFDAAMKSYAEAVEIFDAFAKEKPEELEDFKDKPQALLVALRALQTPLQRNQGHDFEGSGPLVGQVVQDYFEMMNESGSIANSRLRYLD
ncbi:DUF3829 domain-containing protein [uncultured Hyphomicrobium sp.]|uniref:DUF3829 domain-containing protein n=1 Tax=uncultured Hyphomicrobium sp. TaxID=194373 RepID=UPI0025D72437|nr:DUF3829 domain-containing protein [uncultured Hyphomicrobium sp.]